MATPRVLGAVVLFTLAIAGAESGALSV